MRIWRRKESLVIIFGWARHLNTGPLSSPKEAFNSSIRVSITLRLFHPPLGIVTAVRMDTFNLLKVRYLLVAYTCSLANASKTCHDCDERDECSIREVYGLLRLPFSFVVSLVPFLPIFPSRISERRRVVVFEARPIAVGIVAPLIPAKSALRPSIPASATFIVSFSLRWMRKNVVGCDNKPVALYHDGLGQWWTSRAMTVVTVSIRMVEFD